MLIEHNRAEVLHRLISLVFFAFFLNVFYHLAHGDQGYFALKGAELRHMRVEKVYKTYYNQRIDLETRVKTLRPQNLDLDLLEERVRHVLGYIEPEEKIILGI